MRSLSAATGCGGFLVFELAEGGVVSPPAREILQVVVEWGCMTECKILFFIVKGM